MSVPARQDLWLTGRIEAIHRRSRTVYGSPRIPQSWLTITMSGLARLRLDSDQGRFARSRGTVARLRIGTAQVALPQCTDTPRVRCQCLEFLHSDTSWKSRAYRCGSLARCYHTGP
jgi:hypothetical protein